jgi:hypothetical protein
LSNEPRNSPEAWIHPVPDRGLGQPRGRGDEGLVGTTRTSGGIEPLVRV